MKPRLAVSIGDPAGIGPEVAAAASVHPKVLRAARLVFFGDAAVVERACRVRGITPGVRSAMAELEGVTKFKNPPVRPGKRSGEAAFRYLEAAAKAVVGGDCDALVTAPLSKLWMNRAGHDYDGHTGYLSEIAGRPATMMLAGRRLRVVPVTVHMPLASVAPSIKRKTVRDAVSTAAEHLSVYHGIARPRLAVAALNPHGGESGLFGREEIRVIGPALRPLVARGIDVAGPFPADTLFAAAVAGDYDAVVCMYHDQALIPLKLVEFGRAVNVSMGLPFVRTSPDHGTAYGLAGTGKASETSMIEAVLLAADMVRTRSGGKDS